MRLEIFCHVVLVQVLGRLGRSTGLSKSFLAFSISQVLDSEFNDENRLKCNEASKPLLQAVETLTTFASSPEFASIPAKISEKVFSN